MITHQQPPGAFRKECRGNSSRVQRRVLFEPVYRQHLGPNLPESQHPSLVDDQSIDRSGNICDEYARKDRRVSVIHQKNAGPGSARNVALAKIDTQEYVMFVDADDYLAPNAIERCVEAITIHQADMVICNFTNVFDSTGETVKNTMELSGRLNGQISRVSSMEAMI